MGALSKIVNTFRDAEKGKDVRGGLIEIAEYLDGQSVSLEETRSLMLKYLDNVSNHNQLTAELRTLYNDIKNTDVAEVADIKKSIADVNSNLTQKKDNKWSYWYNTTPAVTTNTAWRRMLSLVVPSNTDIDFCLNVKRLYRSDGNPMLHIKLRMKVRNSNGVIDVGGITPVITPTISSNTTSETLLSLSKVLIGSFKTIVNGTTTELWCKGFFASTGSTGFTYDGWYWELSDNATYRAGVQTNNSLVFEAPYTGAGTSEPIGSTIEGRNAVLDKTTQVVLDLLSKYPV